LSFLKYLIIKDESEEFEKNAKQQKTLEMIDGDRHIVSNLFQDMFSSKRLLFGIYRALQDQLRTLNKHKGTFLYPAYGNINISNIISIMDPSHINLSLIQGLENYTAMAKIMLVNMF